MQSYLIQVRGLKQTYRLVTCNRNQSYLIQVRGLKPPTRVPITGNEVVPYIGTWIETWVKSTLIPSPSVVPYIGTWIETGLIRIELLGGTKSYLIQVRGLKHKIINIKRGHLTVVPYIGTWIETKSLTLNSLRVRSYLIQVRGLKHFCLDREHHRHKSYLIQVRGLKQNQLYTRCRPHQVVPYIGTWIETIAVGVAMIGLASYLIQVRGLKLLLVIMLIPFLSRTLYRYVD